MTQVGALSNAAVAYVERVLAVHRLQGHFCVLHGADDVPAPKPAPDGLILCCKELGQDPAHVVYVGDSPSDGLAARAAGMKSIGQLPHGTKQSYHFSIHASMFCHIPVSFRCMIA